MRFDRRDLELLSTIADYRVMTFDQIAALTERHPKRIQSRVFELQKQGGIAKSKRRGPAAPGQREALVSIAPGGFAILREAKVLRSDAVEKDVTLAGLPQVEHQLLLNWVRIHWAGIERLHPALKVRLVPHSSPAPHLGDAPPNGAARPVPVFIRSEGGEVIVPDAVATIRDTERAMTVLFFLEVDMGSEPFEAPQKQRPTILKKIEKYQRYFRTQRYREYDSVWNCSLRGFRVLFVTNTGARATALGADLTHIRPREFIWIASQEDLLKHGPGAAVWARGGHQGQPLGSILGSRAAGHHPKSEAHVEPSSPSQGQEHGRKATSTS